MFGFDSRYDEITVVVGSRSNNTICRSMPALWREHNFSFREPESIDFTGEVATDTIEPRQQ